MTMALTLNAWKGLSMGVFTAINVVGAATAVAMKERTNRLCLSCGAAFSAGVLLAGGLVHLLPASDGAFGARGSAFPWASSVAGAAMVGLTCVELVLDRAVGGRVVLGPGHEHDYERYEDVPPQEIPDEGNRGGDSVGEQRREPRHGRDDLHGHPENSFSAVVLTSALSIHSIIEGLAIGASGDISTIQSAFLAVVAHKGFTSFSLAQGMVSSGYWEEKSKRKYFYISIGTFIFVNLLGIAIGWVLSISNNVGDSVVAAALTGVASGSFIYVAMVEILPQETKTIKRNRSFLPPVIFSLAAGYCLMAVLAIWV